MESPILITVGCTPVRGDFMYENSPFIFQHGLKSLDQFWWFLIWGLVFGALFLWFRKLMLNIVIHWLVILSSMVSVLLVLDG